MRKEKYSIYDERWGSEPSGEPWYNDVIKTVVYGPLIWGFIFFGCWIAAQL